MIYLDEIKSIIRPTFCFVRFSAQSIKLWEKEQAPRSSRFMLHDMLREYEIFSHCASVRCRCQKNYNIERHRMKLQMENVKKQNRKRQIWIFIVTFGILWKVSLFNRLHRDDYLIVIITGQGFDLNWGV